jgi:hypothetical protein
MERDLTAPTTALVIETNNLAGGGCDADTVERSLTRLLARLRTQTRPLASLDEVIVVHDRLAPAVRDRLHEAAGRRLRFVALDAGDDYYAAKDAGFAATGADVVAFADADCWPQPDWLRALLAPFSDGSGVAAVAGRTSYRDDLFGAAATAVDFMYFASPLGAGCTRNFYANNVAFRRDVLARAGFGVHGFYRGSCQVLGLVLQARGIPIRFVAGAHTVHRLPDTAADLARLRLLRGADSVELAPHLAAAYLPRGTRWLARLGPLSGLAVLAARYGCSLMALRRQRLPAPRGPGWLAAGALVSAIHAADAVGAVVRGLRLGLAPPARHARALAYHRDVDALEAPARVS